MSVSATHPGAPCAPAGHAQHRVPSKWWRERRARAFLLFTLAGLAGCGENVFVGNWQLRSLSDAGLDLPEGADAAPNEQAENAAAAREHLRNKFEENKAEQNKGEPKETHDNRSNDEKTNH